MNIEDLEAGTSWACKFRTTTFVDENGVPVKANLNIGQAHPGKPQTYESVGVISVRDVESRKVEVVDIETEQRFIVNFDDCWDLDEVEWID
jgi:hypothetical protein